MKGVTKLFVLFLLLSNVCLNQVRVAGLQNLVKIMSLYYQFMEEYMGRALFAVSKTKFQREGAVTFGIMVFVFCDCFYCLIPSPSPPPKSSECIWGGLIFGFP